MLYVLSFPYESKTTESQEHHKNVKRGATWRIKLKRAIFQRVDADIVYRYIDKLCCAIVMSNNNDNNNNRISTAPYGRNFI